MWCIMRWLKMCSLNWWYMWLSWLSVNGCPLARPWNLRALVLHELAVDLVQHLRMPPRPSLESAVVLEELAAGQSRRISHHRLLQVEEVEVHGQREYQCWEPEPKQAQAESIQKRGVVAEVARLVLQQEEQQEVEHVSPHSLERHERKVEQESPVELTSLAKRSCSPVTRTTELPWRNQHEWG